MRRSLLALLLCLVLPASLGAQRPGEVAGRVAEAGTDAPLEMAAVELPELGIRVWTDGAGRFAIRGVEEGAHRVRVTRAGYAGWSAQVRVRNGEASWLSIPLVRNVLVLDTVSAVTIVPDPQRDGTVVTRAAIEASGARTAADVVARAPGVTVRESGPTGARTVSIRGSGADAVLVLVDGAPLNDPVSGEADLSAVPASAIERVTVLPGAHSARYGARAGAGVVLIETRAGEVPPAAEVSGGTLGERAARGEWGAPVGSAAIQAGAHTRAVDGRFTYERDPSDPARVPRTNADEFEAGAFAALTGSVAGGELRVRGGWETLERGLPGTGHTPSPEARQWMERGRASLAWRRGPASALVSGAVQRARYADPAPPFGLAYDDTTRVRMLNARAESSTGFRRGRLGLGVDALAQHVEAALSQQAPRTQYGGGVFAHASDDARVLRHTLSLSAEARVDRDGVSGNWYASRALTVRLNGPVRVQLANRSAYSPPALGDQFFRGGVGVVPNPDLRPERIPNEWEIGASTATTLGGVSLSAYATAYDSDVRGMIVWMRRFNDRWSPGNVDAHRRGLDLRADAVLPGNGLRVNASYSLARITYDREGRDDDGVQVVYRPRHSGWVGAEWGAGAWRAEARARYTGARNPTPTEANVIPGFWATQLRVARDWRMGAWALSTALDVDRALDEKGHLIAGYPEPGRRARLDVRIQRTQLPSRNRPR
jgi:outer membrane cobalamin receptor